MFKENTLCYGTLKEGAPACSHITYGCFTQNNYGYKDAEYLR